MIEHIHDDDGTVDGCEACFADEPEVPVVVPISKMDDATFIKHYNGRHLGEGGIPIEERTSWPDEVATFRHFHKRLHTTGDELAASHVHSQGDQPWQDGES